MPRPDPPEPAALPAKAAAARWLVPAALLALLWLVLTGGAAASWIVGLPTIAGALLLARRIDAAGPPWRLDLPGMLRFAVYFLRESVRGGIDVALRVGGLRLRVAPGLLRHRWRLPAGSPARSLFVLCVSLLPGTLVAVVGDEDLLIHVLDAGAPVADELARLERQVAGLFALRLPAPESADA